MQSKATTVQEYIAGLPADRKTAIEAVRKIILANLDSGFEEGMQYGMIGYFVPHSLLPEGYHCDPSQPLNFAALASQKNYMSLYLMSNYGNEGELEWFTAEWAKSGKKLDMGKSCIRFRKLEDLALDVIGKAIKRVKTKKYIEQYRTYLASQAKDKSTNTTKKAASVKSNSRVEKSAKKVKAVTKVAKKAKIVKKPK